MSNELTPVIKVGLAFAYVGAFVFLSAGIVLSVRSRKPHPLLLLCTSAISFSWIEAPYDWAVYAQFPPAIPRMPSWWPLNMTWGGLPAAVPFGYVAYFVLPAVIAVAIGRRLTSRFRWRAPLTLLTTGLTVGVLWALIFNAGLGAYLGLFYYGKVIEGLALWEGSRHQYPLYDAVAMGVQMMVFTYLLGRIDDQGRSLIEVWAARRSHTQMQAALLSIAAAIVVGHVVYLSVFAPHLATKLMHLVTVGPTEAFFEGVANQPL